MSSEDSKKISLDLSKAWGAWKHQFTNCERILSFTSCGNHVSNVAYVEKTTGCLRNSTRMTGFSIQNVVNQNQDFDEGIEWILQNALKGKTVKYEVPQVLSFKDNQTAQLYVKAAKYFLKFGMSNQRVCLGNTYATLPFGYNLKLFAELNNDS